MSADQFGDDPLEKWACVAQELEAKLKAANERVKELRVERAAANERIKQLEEQILTAKKQREIAAKLIDQIFREGPKNHAAEVLLNQYFWELV